MTKVLMNVDLLAYQQEMKEALRQVIRENYIGGVCQAQPSETTFMPDDVLVPPDIACILLDAYEGQDDDFIGIMIFHDFAIASVQVAIRDLQGSRIESGDACLFPENPELWSYLPAVPVPTGTTMIVQVTVMDCMGGVGTRWSKKTMGEEEW
jgi:hypothetical protein